MLVDIPIFSEKELVMQQVYQEYLYSLPVSLAVFYRRMQGMAIHDTLTWSGSDFPRAFAKWSSLDTYPLFKVASGRDLEVIKHTVPGDDLRVVVSFSDGTLMVVSLKDTSGVLYEITLPPQPQVLVVRDTEAYLDEKFTRALVSSHD